MFTTATQQNPFPGLRPFQEDESHLFFGRSKQVNELLQTLQKTRFLAIVGASGSGKSSLVKCGMIPSLRKNGLTDSHENWNIATFTPGNAPYQNMAKSLVENVFYTNENEDNDYQTAITEAALRRSSKGLIELYKERFSEVDSHLLVIIDQFEEIFRFRKQEIQTDAPQQDTVSFINLLLETANLQEVPIYIVFTMRSDYLGDCTLFRGLPEAINDGQYLIPRMTREERKTAVLGPMEIGGATATQQLVTRLMNDVGDNPDQLPILQHALMRTWNYWNKNERPETPIDLKHYEAIGGMSASLSRHAEEAFAELKTDRERRICELMFKALTEKGVDNKGTRRPLKLDEICKVTDASEQEVKQVIEVFRQQGRSFLMPAAPKPIHKDSIIDISHESLMRVWNRLIRWVDEEQQSADTYLRLAESAALYQQSQSGLWRDPELQIAQRWQKVNEPNAEWAKRYNPSFERAISFLEYSQKQYEFEIAEKERRQQRRLKRTRLIAITVGIAAIMALILATYAIFQRAEAENQKQLAETERLKAEINEQEAVKQKDIADVERSKAQKNAQEAIKQKNRATIERLEAIRQKDEAQRQREEALRQRQIAETEKERADKLRAIAVANEALAKEQKNIADDERSKALKNAEIARENARIARENAKKAERLKNLADARNKALESIKTINSGDVQKGTQDAIAAYKINKSNNGPSQNDDNYQALHHANLANYSDAYLQSQPSSVKAISVTQHRIAIANEEGRITLLKQSKTKLEPQFSFKAKNDHVVSMTFTKDKKSIITSSYEGNLRVWKTNQLNEKSKPFYSKNCGMPIYNVTPLKGGAVVCHSSKDIIIENITENVIQTKFTKGYDKISHVTATQDGNWVIVASKTQLYLHPVNQNLTLGTAQSITLKKTITQVAITKDKKYIAAGLNDGEIAIIKLDKNLNVINTQYENAHRTQISGLAFFQHSDFLQLASSSYDNTAQLLDVTNLNNKDNPQDKIILRGHTKWIYNLMYSLDGKYIYTSNEDKTVRKWHTQTKDMVENLGNTN